MPLTTRILQAWQALSNPAEVTLSSEIPTLMGSLGRLTITPSSDIDNLGSVRLGRRRRHDKALGPSNADADEAEKRLRKAERKTVQIRANTIAMLRMQMRLAGCRRLLLRSLG